MSDFLLYGQAIPPDNFNNKGKVMKLAKIAVETPLEDVKQALEEKGHEVIMFTNEEEAKGSNLAVVRTLSETVADAEQFGFPFVSMEGMSVDEIVEDVEQRLNR